MMNEIKHFLLFNPEYKNANITIIKKIYNEQLRDGRVVSIESFLKTYPEFDSSSQNISINDLVDYHIQKKMEKLEKLEKLEKNTEEKENIVNPLNFFENKNNNNNHPEKILPKIAHIFVHFFEIGGGENYLSKFNTYACHKYSETLFINRNYQTNTLFKYNLNIILYDSYEILNNILIETQYDIIIDHQLYWFDPKIQNICFKNVNPYIIIRITHGVPIHQENITCRNYYYSIELYNDTLSHNSWNNHIKYYHNIGVSLPKLDSNSKTNKVNLKNIKIALVGRINEEKIPKLFLNELIKFVKNNNNYKFNFYGLIDKSYKNHFMKSIDPKYLKNILYHGVVDPNEISSIYLENDILMHPSKYEAGATVILEAMSYGLPVITRNSSGMKYALHEEDPSISLLCNNDNEFFQKLLIINSSNYHTISEYNRQKIINYNNEKVVYPYLINEIDTIYNYHINFSKNNQSIPNIIHYIFGLKKQTEEFLFVYYLSIYSNIIINKPNIIYFHYQYEPYGEWWSKIKPFLKLNYVNVDHIYWGNKKIIKVAHKADKLRLDLLLKYGGIYMDIDTISYKPYKSLLEENPDFIIGIQEENYGTDFKTLYCNAILFSKKDHFFIKEWINEYENHFDPKGWCEASVHLPEKIIKILEKNPEKYDLSKIKILEKEYFYVPLYNEVTKIFIDPNIIPNDKLITLHYWNSFSEKYLKNIIDFDWALNNNKTLFAKIMNHIYHIKKNNI